MRYRLDIQELFTEIAAVRSFVESRRREMLAQRVRLAADREEMRAMFESVADTRRRLGLRTPKS